MQTSEKLEVLLDRCCHFCSAMAELLRVLDWRHHLHCPPFQTPGVPQAYGLITAQCEQAVWVISSDGSRSQGAQAVKAVLDAMVGLPLFRLLYHFLGMGPMENEIYTCDLIYIQGERQWSQTSRSTSS